MAARIAADPDGAGAPRTARASAHYAARADLGSSTDLPFSELMDEGQRGTDGGMFVKALWRAAG